MTEKYATNIEEILERLNPLQKEELIKEGIRDHQRVTYEILLSNILNELTKKKEERDMTCIKYFTKIYRERLKEMESWGIDIAPWEKALKKGEIGDSLNLKIIQ